MSEHYIASLIESFHKEWKAAHAPKETGIKPDTAQAARHELVAQSKSQHKRLVAQAAIKQEPSVPISKLKELRHNIDSYAFSQLEKLIDKAEKDW